ncbi:hypothetical protein F9L00_22820 [Brucella anthropi]|uniref:Uncharacterized protein n=1 Tax=Brucella anthropi TaxID=529 RepID=A0A6L3Z3B8_BRUAN|nr:hypothetical protein [Brucella anthropi]KAB2766794.1 hypothetical protein F9L04_16105 [Brucella anthropi]KAB2774077.1 hypothetical protein F9L00_22820 [Brucella anthropi]
MSNIQKNITAGLQGISEFERLELQTQAEKWAADKHRPNIPFQRLAELAFVEGLSLAKLPCAPDYSQPAQSKAWITAALLGAMYQISAAYQRKSENAALATAVGRLRASNNELVAENRAAWRAVDLKVPFREPRPLGRRAFQYDTAESSGHHDGALRGKRITRAELHKQRPDLAGDVA